MGCRFGVAEGLALLLVLLGMGGKGREGRELPTLVWLGENELRAAVL
jgi:hypothetical protein